MEGVTLGSIMLGVKDEECNRTRRKRMGRSRMDEKQAFERGKHYAIHKADMFNCHFSCFETRELKEAWEKGMKSGLSEKEAK